MSDFRTPVRLLPEYEFARQGHSHMRPVLWSLWSDGLRLAAPGEAERFLPYTALSSIRLYVETVEGLASIYHCALAFEKGQKLDFTNYQMTGPGKVEHQNTGYQAFVKTLLEQAELHAPACKLLGGQKPRLYTAAKVLTFIAAPCALVYLYAAWLHNGLLHALVNVSFIMAPLLAIFGNPPKPINTTTLPSLLPAS